MTDEDFSFASECMSNGCKDLAFYEYDLGGDYYKSCKEHRMHNIIDSDAESELVCNYCGKEVDAKEKIQHSCDGIVSNRKKKRKHKTPNTEENQPKRRQLTKKTSRGFAGVTREMAKHSSVIKNSLARISGNLLVDKGYDIEITCNGSKLSLDKSFPDTSCGPDSIKFCTNHGMSPIQSNLDWINESILTHSIFINLTVGEEIIDSIELTSKSAIKDHVTVVGTQNQENQEKRGMKRTALSKNKMLEAIFFIHGSNYYLVAVKLKYKWANSKLVKPDNPELEYQLKNLSMLVEELSDDYTEAIAKMNKKLEKYKNNLK